VEGITGIGNPLKVGNAVIVADAVNVIDDGLTRGRVAEEGDGNDAVGCFGELNAVAHKPDECVTVAIFATQDGSGEPAAKPAKGRHFVTDEACDGTPFLDQVAHNGDGHGQRCRK